MTSESYISMYKYDSLELTYPLKLKENSDIIPFLYRLFAFLALILAYTAYTYTSTHHLIPLQDSLDIIRNTTLKGLSKGLVPRFTAKHLSTGVTPPTQMQFQYRPSQTRGGANHGWLKTLHTFSFADYYSPEYSSFGALRVINEDRVSPGTGFPTHRHAEFEIFSYIISGELSHKDSMGNVETMKRGDVQMTSGGTGIAHSEYNDHKSEDVHFLQIWAKPYTARLPPQYYTRHFTDEEKLDKIVTIVAPARSDEVIDQREANGPTPVHSPLHAFVTLLNPEKTVTHTLHKTLNENDNEGKGEKLFYAQLIQSSGFNTQKAVKDGSKALIKISSGTGQDSSSVLLGEGDGVFVRKGKTGEELKIENVGDKRGELILFEMDA